MANNQSMVLSKVLKKDQLAESFAQEYELWKKGISCVSVAFVALKYKGLWSPRRAQLHLLPIPFNIESHEYIQTESIFAGLSKRNLSANALDSFMIDFLSGKLDLGENSISVNEKSELSYYCRREWPEAFVFNKQIEIRCDYRTNHHDDPPLHKINDELRSYHIPFDGLQDLFNYLGLQFNGYPSGYESIVTLASPAGIKKCHIDNNQLSLELEAHPSFGVNEISVGVVATTTPNEQYTRINLSPLIEWSHAEDRLVGKGSLSINHLSAAQILMAVNGQSIVRNWYVDEKNPPNPRASKYLCLDAEFHRLKKYLDGGNTDSDAFEKGVSILAWILGFNPTLVAETESPDILVETPSGKIAVIECTKKIKDIRVKAGKLIDRRYELSKKMRQIDPATGLIAALVVNLPKDQMADERTFLSANKILLITNEQLEQLLGLLTTPPTPEKYFAKAIQKINSEVPPGEGIGLSN